MLIPAVVDITDDDVTVIVDLSAHDLTVIVVDLSDRLADLEERMAAAGVVFSKAGHLARNPDDPPGPPVHDS